MGLKRLFKKTVFGGDLIRGHIIDAIQKKAKSGKSFRDCLEESVKETLTEDLPGTSNIYQMGRKDGRIQGTAEQAARDEKKLKEIQEKHETDRKRWNEQKQAYEDLLDEAEKMF